MGKRVILKQGFRLVMVKYDRMSVVARPRLARVSD